jgi:hypothetical protein
MPAVYSLQLGDPQQSEKVAAFDFDGTLVNTAVRRHGADAWSLLFNTVPQKLQQLHNDGFQIVSELSCTDDMHNRDEEASSCITLESNKEPAFQC